MKWSGLYLAFSLILGFTVCSAQTPTPEPVNLISIDHYWGGMGFFTDISIDIRNDSASVGTFALDLGYDTAVLEFHSGTAGDVQPVSGWQSLTFNTAVPGHVTVSGVASGDPVPSGSEGSLAVLRFLGVWDLPVSVDADLIVSDLQGDIAGFGTQNGMYSIYYPVLLCSGDVNGNERITSGDAQMAFLIALGFYYPTQEEEAAADCDCNGQATAGDAQRIFNTALMMDACVDPIPDR